MEHRSIPLSKALHIKITLMYKQIPQNLCFSSMTPVPFPNADAAFERGVAAQKAGNLKHAISEWGEALRINPKHGGALYHMAVALTLSADEDSAEAMYQKILAQDPVHRDALFNLANLKMRQELDHQAERLYLRLVEAHPGFIGGLVNLAKVYSSRGDTDAAEPLLCKALALDPSHVVAHWNFAHLLLRKRQWRNAWREYEWRLRLPDWFKPPVSAPEWVDGVSAKRVLLWNDQGLGDALQFLRYARFVAQRGHEVCVLVQDTLKTIAASAPGVAMAFGPSDPLPAIDAHAPLLSLPHRLGLPEPRMAGAEPYLTSGKLFPLQRKPGKKAVGLAWAGNQAFLNDKNRSASFSSLLPLFDVKGAAFYSLQFGPASAQIQKLHFSDSIEDLTPHLRDFSDTAAALESLDLVICVDTATAHLAGALGRPCWVMLAAQPDWRWLEDGEASSWYSSVRLFKQQTPGDWDDVALRMKEALEKMIGSEAHRH